MKRLITSVIIFSLIASCFGDEPKGESKNETEVPEGPLNKTEKNFLGKWRGSRDIYKWEIVRNADRTFEIAITEKDLEDPTNLYHNYAVGVWWVEGKDYKFEWTKWWGDEGEFAGVLSEKVDKVEADKVVTLTESDGDRHNIELRVSKFEMKEWQLKPKKKAVKKLKKSQSSTIKE